MDKTRIENAVKEILSAIGEDPERDGLKNTPARVARMYTEILAGHENDPGKHLETTFEENYNEVVILKDIPFNSLCEHHMLPFFGKAHIAYLPKGRIVGLSKIPRIVDCFARRLQVQERLTMEIAKALQSILRPRGVGVVVEAQHLCMMMRGVEKQNSR